eukprot:702200-Pleurochrysis_carterae.AAC.1
MTSPTPSSGRASLTSISSRCRAFSTTATSMLSVLYCWVVRAISASRLDFYLAARQANVQHQQTAGKYMPAPSDQAPGRYADPPLDFVLQY